MKILIVFEVKNGAELCDQKKEKKEKKIPRTAAFV